MTAKIGKMKPVLFKWQKYAEAFLKFGGIPRKDRPSKEADVMKKGADFIKNITLLGQFSFSLITPLLLCLLICWWLTAHTPVRSWIYIPGFFFGLGGSGMTAYKFYLSVIKKDKADKTDKKISFNDHL